MGGDQPVSKPLPAHRTKQTSISRMGFESMTPRLERRSRFHAADRAGSMTCGAFKMSVLMNFSFTSNRGLARTAERLPVSQGLMRSMELGFLRFQTG
jgi:hypothetical protein